MTRLAPDSNRILSNLEHGGMAPAVMPRYRPRGMTLVGGALILAAAGLAWLAWLSGQPEPASNAGAALAPLSLPAPYAAPSVARSSAHLAAPQAAAIIHDIAPPQAKASLIKASAGAPPRQKQHKAPAPQMAKKTAPPWKKTTAPLAVESDVVLLAALVAHASNQALPEGIYNRDVVLRRDGDATDTLLRRCKQLGLIEGMLCRSRMCAGRWDSDLACR